jgi:hypothetical protein
VAPASRSASMNNTGRVIIDASIFSIKLTCVYLITTPRPTNDHTLTSESRQKMVLDKISVRLGYAITSVSPGVYVHVYIPNPAPVFNMVTGSR